MRKRPFLALEGRIPHPDSQRSVHHRVNPPVPLALSPGNPPPNTSMLPACAFAGPGSAKTIATPAPRMAARVVIACTTERSPIRFSLLAYCATWCPDAPPPRARRRAPPPGRPARPALPDVRSPRVGRRSGPSRAALSGARGPRGRRVLCGGAGFRPGGVGAGVHRGGAGGARSASRGVRAALRSGAGRRRPAPVRAPLDPRGGRGRAAVDTQAHARGLGLRRAVLPRRRRPLRARRRAGARSVRGAGLGLRPRACLRRRPAAPGRVVFPRARRAAARASGSTCSCGGWSAATPSTSGSGRGCRRRGWWCPSTPTSSGWGGACGSPATAAPAGRWPARLPTRCGGSTPTTPSATTSRCATSA